MDKDKKSNRKLMKKIEKEIKTKNKIKNKKEVVEESIILTKPYLIDKEELKESRKLKLLTFIELVVVCIFSIIMLILLCNRTFFTTKYKTSKLHIDIPLMMFYKSDDGNTLTLKTLRKSKYVEDFFNEKLSKLTKYNCGSYSFYYDDIYKTAFYSIDIDKDFAIKKVTINYANGNANCLCSAGVIGSEAEKICSK